MSENVENKDKDAIDVNCDVSGSFNDNIKLKKLIRKWEVQADRLKAMADDVNNGKSQRRIFNHFLIQLYKCIGDAQLELTNCN